MASTDNADGDDPGPRVPDLTTALRAILIASGLVYAAFTYGFATRADWATRLWLWPDTPLSHSFIGSVCGALAIGAGWSGLTGHLHAVAGSLRGLVVIYGGVGVYLLALVAKGEGALIPHAEVALLTGAAALALLVAVTRLPPPPAEPPLEPVVRISTAVFAAALFLAGAALVARIPGIFPWPLSGPSSTVFALIFLGLSTIYADVARTGARGAAIVAMSGFLVYDLILLPPFLGHFDKVPAELVTSLSVYVAVLIYSAGLALWFLPRTFRTKGP